MNEELETSKEELQSLNEESVTVNAELQARIEELSNTNDDMKNLLDSTHIATVFLDTNLRVRRFTPMATRIIPLHATDTGRPINHLATSLVDTDLSDYATQVLTDLVVREVEVQSGNGDFYVMRVRPYRTVANVIDGVVVTFEDITDRKRAATALEASEIQLRIITDTIPTLISYIDAEQRYRFVNKSLEDWLGSPRDEICGRRVEQALGKAAYQAIRGHMETALSGKSVCFELDTELQGQVRSTEATYVPNFGPQGEVRGFYAFVQDVTERKLREQTSTELEQRCRMLFESVSDSIALVDLDTGALVEFNRKAHEDLGYHREEFANLTIRDILTAESVSDTTGYFEIAVNQSNVFTATQRAKDGAIHNVRVKVEAITIGGRKFLMSTWHEITPEAEKD